MRRNSRIFLVPTTAFIAIALALSLSSTGYAYQCAYRDPKVILTSKKTTFVGEVIYSTPKLVKMKIKKLYRGDLSSEVDIIYPDKPSVKDKKLSMFKAGETYLISTNSTVVAEPDKLPQIALKMCEIAQELKTSDELLKWLETPEFQKAAKAKNEK